MPLVQIQTTSKLSLICLGSPPQGTFLANIIVSKLHPDIVIFNTIKKSVYLVELTVPFEQNISKAHKRKAHKYADLVLDISKNGYNCNLACIEISLHGLDDFWDFFFLSKPNNLNHSIKASVRLASSLPIPSGMLTTNPPGGYGPTSPPVVIAVLSLLIILLICWYDIFVTFAFVFCLVLHISGPALLTMVHDLGFCVQSFCLLDIFFVYIFC